MLEFPNYISTDFVLILYNNLLLYITIKKKNYYFLKIEKTPYFLILIISRITIKMIDNP